MAHGLHPQTQLLHEGVRVNLRVMELPRRGGGVQRREIAEVADAVVILPWLGDPAALPPAGRPSGPPEAAAGGGPLGEVVLIRNERFAVKRTLWELPAGTLEAGEDPAECARRELEEETGYRAQHMVKLTEFFASPGFSTELMHAYLAVGLTKTRQSLDETERIVPEVRRFGDALAMCRSGQIIDGKSLATLLWFASFGLPESARV